MSTVQRRAVLIRSTCAQAARSAVQNVVNLRTQHTQFIRQSNLTDGGKEIIFFVPPSIIKRCDFEVGGAKSERCAEFVAASIASYQRLVTPSLVNEHGIVLQSQVRVIPVSRFDDSDRFMLHSLLVGLQVRPEAAPADETLSDRMYHFHDHLMLGFFTGIARQFRNDLYRRDVFHANRRPQEAALQKVDDGHRIFFYIPFDDLTPDFQKLWFQQMEKKPEAANGYYTTLEDAQTGLELTIPYAQQSAPKDFATQLHDHLCTALEASLNTFMGENDDRMPAFTPRPKLYHYLDLDNRDGQAQQLMGIGVGVQFVHGALSRTEEGALLAETAVYAKERRRSRQPLLALAPEA